MGRRSFGESRMKFLFSPFCLLRPVADFYVLRRFEAFDEPWKKSFDTPTQKWESKWGLMDGDRNLKDGVTIPDCGGTTVEKPY